MELNVMMTGKDMKGSCHGITSGTVRTSAETISLCLGRKTGRKLSAMFCDKMLDKYRTLMSFKVITI